jgi:uncharacterized protein with PIN domain
MSQMKFIADAMLGRLAKWLRILGVDVLYDPRMDDRQVIRVARQQQRIILTRDRGFTNRKGLAGSVIFITSSEPLEQLREIRGKMDFTAAEPQGRCVACNGVLEGVARETVREVVPDFVFHTVSHFMKCRDCDKVYWKGSHYEKFADTVKTVLKEGDEA